MIHSIRNSLVSIMLAVVLIFGFLVSIAPSAKAETTTVVYHRSYSQIPTVRVWEGYDGAGHGVGQYFDLGRDQTAGYFNIPFDIDYIYIPTGWCFQDNVYNNGVFVAQAEYGPGPRWAKFSDTRYNSVFIHAPGSDGICN